MFDVSGLTGLPDGARLDDLPQHELGLLQKGLAASCYDVGPIDGLIGSRTRTAYADLVDDLGGGDPTRVTGPACGHLEARAGELGAILGRPADSAEAVRARIREACAFARLAMPEQIAYVMATAKWETNHTFQPVREAYWVDNAEDWRRDNLRYWPFYGRGYVQLTWKRNYEAYADITGIDLLAHPDEALRPDVALFVLVHGMKNGIFTGKRLEDYVRPGHVDFRNARRVINGLDRADDIAAIAREALEPA